VKKCYKKKRTPIRTVIARENILIGYVEKLRANILFALR